MATFSKPTDVPRWADTNALIIEPPEAKKDAGWLFQEVPPSNFENWKAQLNGQWWKWVDERWRDGASPDEIEIIDPVSTLAMASFEDGRFTSGRSETDGINLFGLGAVKSLTFDTALNQMRYDTATDQFEFRCNSASEAFKIGPTVVTAVQPMVVGVASPTGIGGLRVQNGLAVGAAVQPGAGQAIIGNQINVGSNVIPSATESRFALGLAVGASAQVLAAGEFLADKIYVNDEGFSIHLDSSDDLPIVDFSGNEQLAIRGDTNDTGFMFFKVANVDEFAIKAEHVEANAFVPTNSGDRDINPYEVGKRNQICLAVSGTFLSGGSVEAGTRTWNVDGVDLVATGRYEVTSDDAILDDAIPIATARDNIQNGFAFPAGASLIEVHTTNMSGTLTTGRFHLIVVAG